MYTLVNTTDLLVNEDTDTNSTRLSSTTEKISSILLIFILSILCFFGVLFMIFGPMMRSEAWKRVDNYIFGQENEPENQDDAGGENVDV